MPSYVETIIGVTQPSTYNVTASNLIHIQFMNRNSIKTAAVAAVVGGVVLGAVSASAALNLPTMSCSYMFNTNMRMGSRGADVQNLQTVLNMYPQTQVAVAGAGSPGMETMTFGPATRAAVVKFQNLHLAELGITSGTGNVFALTRGLLNQVCSGTSSNTGNTGNTGGNTGGTPVSTGPVSVMLSASQPAGMIVAGQAGARIADFTFTGNGTVTSLELQRVGVSTDSTLTNVYLYDGNTRITDAASVVTGGYIRFNAGSGIFTVNGSRTLTVRADIASGTNGQSVGVKVNSLTALGSAAATFTSIVGNSLQIASVTTATVNLNAMDTTSRTVDAGTTNYNVWSATANVGTRDVWLKAATFKFVGSAPTDAVANLSLYVDGARVAGPSMVNPMNNNKISFDLGATPYRLLTGSHTVDLRGDIVKGSNRTIRFSVENVADLMLEDRDLAGVNVSATVASAALTNGNSAYGQITVNRGSVVTNVDPNFVANKVTGGATNMTVASFTMRAYGEDVKVNSLNVTPSLSGTSPAAAGLTNVGLFLNGGQIGSSQNWTSGALTFNLGSSLIIPAGQVVTVSVKADVKTTGGVSYTAGTVAASVGGVADNAQGQSSNELVSVANPSVLGNSLTVSSGVGTFARTAGFTDKTIAPNTSNVKIGSFTLQAGSAEATVINGATVSFVLGGGMLTSNLTNLTLKDGSTVLGTPIGSVTASNTVSFTDITVPINGTKTLDVYADFGGASAGTARADMTISTRGPVSGTTAASSATGIVVTPSVAALAAPVLVSSSPVSQYVVGSSNMTIATFKLKTSTSEATVRELRFAITGTDSVQSVTVNGVQAPVVGTTAIVTGLSIPVTTTGTDVPVTVQYAGFKNSTQGGSLTAGVNPVTVVLNYTEAISGTGSVISTTTVASSSDMKLYASRPTVTNAGGSGTLNVGTQLLGQFTVAADANGSVAIATTSLIISTSTGGTLNVTNVRLSDDNGATSIPFSNTVAGVSSGTAFQIGFTTPFQIAAGQSKTFQVWGTVAGSSWGTSGNTSLSAQLDTNLGNFRWYDVVTDGSYATPLAGTGIQNWPTASYVLRN